MRPPTEEKNEVVRIYGEAPLRMIRSIQFQIQA